MNDNADGGGSFVRRMSALARKGRSRRRESGVAASPSAGGAAGGAAATPASTSTAQEVPAAAAFVNEGLERWNAQHKEWCSGRSASRAQGTARRRRAGDAAFGEGKATGDTNAEVADSGSGFDSDELYNELLSPQYTPFPKRVKLSKLVEVLVDVWESDGT
jgi:hypothetical protein